MKNMELGYILANYSLVHLQC